MNLSLYIRGDNSDHHSMLVVKIFMKKVEFHRNNMAIKLSLYIREIFFLRNQPLS